MTTWAEAVTICASVPGRQIAVITNAVDRAAVNAAIPSAIQYLSYKPNQQIEYFVVFLFYLVSQWIGLTRDAANIFTRSDGVTFALADCGTTAYCKSYPTGSIASNPGINTCINSTGNEILLVCLCLQQSILWDLRECTMTTSILLSNLVIFFVGISAAAEVHIRP